MIDAQEGWPLLSDKIAVQETAAHIRAYDGVVTSIVAVAMRSTSETLLGSEQAERLRGVIERSLTKIATASFLSGVEYAEKHYGKNIEDGVDEGGDDE